MQKFVKRETNRYQQASIQLKLIVTITFRSWHRPFLPELPGKSLRDSLHPNQMDFPLIPITHSTFGLLHVGALPPFWLLCLCVFIFMSLLPFCLHSCFPFICFFKVSSFIVSLFILFVGAWCFLQLMENLYLKYWLVSYCSKWSWTNPGRLESFELEKFQIEIAEMLFRNHFVEFFFLTFFNY